MAIEYICTYNDYLDSFGPLSDEEFGKLIRAGIRYNAMGEPTELDGSLGVAFAVMRAQIDRDRKRYDKRCEKNRENINKRWQGKENAEEEPGKNGDSIRSYTNDTNNKTKTNTNTKNNNNTKTNNNNNTNNKKNTDPRGEVDPYGPFGPLGTCGAQRYSFYTGHGADKGADAPADGETRGGEPQDMSVWAKKIIDAAAAVAERNRRNEYGK